MEESLPGRGRSGRLVLGLATFLLTTVVAGLAWFCLGVTRFGRYTILGPGYAGRVKMAGYEVHVSRGWNRKVEIDLSDFRIGVTLPEQAGGFSMPVEPSLAGQGEPREGVVVACSHHAGFVLVTESKSSRGAPAGTAPSFPERGR